MLMQCRRLALRSTARYRLPQAAIQTVVACKGWSLATLKRPPTRLNLGVDDRRLNLGVDGDVAMRPANKRRMCTRSSCVVQTYVKASAEANILSTSRMFCVRSVCGMYVEALT